MAANGFSEEQAIALGSILSKIPAEQRSRVDMLVQAENSKTLEAIENSKSDVEKHIALAVKVMRFFQASLLRLVHRRIAKVITRIALFPQ